MKPTQGCTRSSPYAFAPRQRRSGVPRRRGRADHGRMAGVAGVGADHRLTGEESDNCNGAEADGCRRKRNPAAERDWDTGQAGGRRAGVPGAGRHPGPSGP